MSTNTQHLTTSSSEKPITENGLPETNASEEAPQNDHSQKPSALRITLVITSVLLSMFLVMLDRTIISTATPQISDEFNALADVGWYGSSYLITSCAFQLVFGKIYTFFPVKTTLLFCILLFEVSSAICGAAPTSGASIVGRALAGVGSAGIFAGTVTTLRHQIQGLFGAVMRIASITGPLIGGGFTSNVTWRWCFHINLPVGGVAMLVILFFLDIPDGDTKMALTRKLMQMDIPGTAVLVPEIVCLLLALQWGGQEYDWSDGRVVALLTLSGVLLVAFVAVQMCLPKTATLPPRLFKQRSVIAGCWSALCINCGNYVIIYFLPIWFQAIKGVTAAESGIRTLPLMISTVIGSVTGGLINSKIGYYTPLAIIGTSMMSIGAGLLTALLLDTGAGKWIGYQIIYGLGLGWCFQIPNLAAQAALPKKDVPMGLALMIFSSLFGAAVFVSAGENVLETQLLRKFSMVPGFDAGLVASGGATSLLESLPSSLQEIGLKKYNQALRVVFMVGLVPACLSVIGAISLEWRSVKKPVAKVDAEASAKENIDDAKA
ncbi:hypothetical protein N7526_004245 [Penicillium atrosanguineum]|nr:hypothetical protein N7526_004245 [Penicillium atrosanguineum]